MTNQPPRVETLNYRPGGFHPVHLDDIFKKGRYIIIHKLGYGGFATVWLARDTTRERYVAIKILAARLSRDCPEVEILRRLKKSEDHAGKAYVMSMLDHFWIKGPNGSHLCVVSEVGGPSIKQFNDCPGFTSGTRRLRGAVARKVALQATEGLAYIHATGIVHGDFTAANILLQLANIDEWTVAEIHDRLGEPQTQVLHRTSGQTGEFSGPRYTVNAISMKLVDPQWLSDQIMIIDFGIAFLEEQSSLDIGTPKNYCAPEFNFNCPRSISSDIWALGCTVFEIRTGSCLFRYRGSPTRDQMLTAVVKILGNLPDIWWDLWEDGKTWYKLEIQARGQLADIIPGTLYHEIMKIGLHDGDSHTAQPTHKDLGFGADNEDGNESHRMKYASSEKHLNITGRLVALVEELTTSEANFVLAQIENPLSAGSSYDKTGSSPEKTGPGTGESTKAQSGSGSTSASGSSAAKSGEKSISSEGISTGAETNAGTTTEQALGMNTGADRRLPRTGDVAPPTCAEFLEPFGTIISVVEALALESLLRKAMQLLPENRASAAELAKHNWFFDNFEGRA
ncbi:kinase-like domain-containing protein [Rhexocercosporidium sp. MPI-PUGE-AT-0058]|nr:kinase-like domain-containing protein [Rhexocercosporidium sp. MPI-PUGE-AT-0058]